MPRAVMFAKRLPAVVLTAAMFAAVYTPAAGTPEFARRTMLSCNACHSVGTRLTELGRTYMAGGFLLPALPRTMPAVAVRGQAVYSSDPDPTGLPKAIVDEIDLLSARQIGKHFVYNSEAYALDGGRIGSGREAWPEYRSGEFRPVPLAVRAARVKEERPRNLGHDGRDAGHGRTKRRRGLPLRRLTFAR